MHFQQLWLLDGCLQLLQETRLPQSCLVYGGLVYGGLVYGGLVYGGLVYGGPTVGLVACVAHLAWL